MYSSQQISSFICDALAQIPHNITLIEKGVMTYKYEFEIGSASFIIRVYPERIEKCAVEEYNILQRAYTAHCKVPTPVLLSVGVPHFIIYEKVRGNDLSHFSDLPIVSLENIAASIAENVYQLSGIVLDHYGAILDDNKKYNSWNEFLHDGINTGFEYLSRSSVLDPHDLRKVKEFMIRRADHYHCSHPGLTWSDLSVDNIIIHNNDLAGFVDFDGSMGGDPILSLGYLFAKTGTSEFYLLIEKEFKNFFSFDFEDMLFYSIFRLARLAKFLDEPLPTGIERDPVLAYFKGITFSIDHVLNKSNG